MNFTVLHSIPDYAEGGQPAESREREEHQCSSWFDRVRRWLGATVVQPASVGSQSPQPLLEEVLSTTRRPPELPNIKNLHTEVRSSPVIRP